MNAAQDNGRTEQAILRLGDPSASAIEAAQKFGPRDLVTTEKQIITTIAKAGFDLAESLVYCKPVGKDRVTGRQQFAIGPSVRLTEVGQQAFGGLWVNVDVQVSKGSIEAVAKVFDCRTCNVYHARASRSVGNVTNETVIENWCNGASSIARRNALLQAMRPQLIEAEALAKRMVIAHYAGSKALDDLSMEDRVAAYTKAFEAVAAEYAKRWGTTVAELRQLVADEGDAADRLWMLIGIKNYLVDNESKYSDVFGKDATLPTATTVRPAAPTAPKATTTPAAPAATLPPTQTTSMASQEAPALAWTLDATETTAPPAPKAVVTPPAQPGAKMAAPAANDGFLTMIRDIAKRKNLSDEELDAVASERIGVPSLSQIVEAKDQAKFIEWLLGVLEPGGGDETAA